jgi:hypothetical protein
MSFQNTIKEPAADGSLYRARVVAIAPFVSGVALISALFAFGRTTTRTITTPIWCEEAQTGI